jgi:ATP-dependent Lon protease
VIIPHGNARDVEELPEEVQRSVHFHPVRTMDEVLAIALRATGSPGASDAIADVSHGVARQVAH